MSGCLFKVRPILISRLVSTCINAGHNGLRYTGQRGLKTFTQVPSSLSIRKVQAKQLQRCRVATGFSVGNKQTSQYISTTSVPLMTYGHHSNACATHGENDHGENLQIVGGTFSSGHQMTEGFIDTDSSWIGITWTDGTTTHYPFLWLRDNCQCSQCFSPSSESRLFAMADLDMDSTPLNLKISPDWMDVTWSDGHVSRWNADWLQGRSFTPEVQERRRKWLHPRVVRHWGAELQENIPTFDFDKLLKNDRTLYEWITALEEIGLALVKDTPREPGQIRRIAEKVAFLRTTHYGEEFTVKAKADPSNLAYTTAGLGFHTDLPFYIYTPGMQMLHCIQQIPTKGGANQLVDGFRIAEILKERHPEMYELLVTTPIDFIDTGTDHGKFFKVTRHPTIGLDAEGNITKISQNNMVRDSFLHVPLDVVNDLYRAMGMYNQIAYEPDNHIDIKLEDGDIVCFHNYRVLHGRSAYRLLESRGERHLEGGYIDWDELNSRRRVLMADLKLYQQ